MSILNGEVNGEIPVKFEPVLCQQSDFEKCTRRIQSQITVKIQNTCKSGQTYLFGAVPVHPCRTEQHGDRVCPVVLALPGGRETHPLVQRGVKRPSEETRG